MTHTPESLKKVMKERDLNWRTFANPGDLTNAWNSPGTPTFYLIDAEGIIRRKWEGHPGERVIDEALEVEIGKIEGKERKR